MISTPYRLTPDKHADMHTRSGVPVYLGDPWRTAILAKDLRAHASGLSRYNGAPRVTVLQHSVLVAMLAEAAGEVPYIVAQCAAHDLAEAVPLGEVVSGLKRRLPEYQEFEHAWEPRIRAAVGLPEVMPLDVKTRIKVYDKRALLVELWWHNHPARLIKTDHQPTARERRIGWQVFGPLIGCTPVLWWRMTRWLPKLQEVGPL